MEKHLIEELETKRAQVVKIFKFSNVDGPGNRMAIFFQGCNFNCKYCHNPETIPFTNPEVKLMSVKDIMDMLGNLHYFLEGITVSGGEATLNYEFVSELFKEIKGKYPNLTCFVDTNGSLDLSEAKFEELMNTTDKFMLDVKAWDNTAHESLTDMENKIVIKNLDYLIDLNKIYEVRVVVLENEIFGSEETVKNVSEKIKNTDIKLKLIKYRPHGVREEMKKELRPPSVKKMERLRDISLEIGVNGVQII